MVVVVVTGLPFAATGSKSQMNSSVPHRAGEVADRPHALATSESELMSNKKQGVWFQSPLWRRGKLARLTAALLHHEPYFEAGDLVAQGVCAKTTNTSQGSKHGKLCPGLRGRVP